MVHCDIEEMFTQNVINIAYNSLRKYSIARFMYSGCAAECPNAALSERAKSPRRT
jgi:hypothetical protein